MIKKRKNKKSFRNISFDIFHLEAIHDKWIDTKNRQMWIHSFETVPSQSQDEPGIEYNMATRVIKNLHILRKLNPNEPITIHLHSCGGDVDEGLAIYDALKAMPYKITMISYTHARSMSSYILQAADLRLLMPSSYFMFHRGTIALAGPQQEVESNIEFSKIQDKLLMDIYVDSLKRTGKFRTKSRQWIEKMINDHMNQKSDVFLTAPQAVEWGFADGLVNKF